MEWGSGDAMVTARSLGFLVGEKCARLRDRFAGLIGRESGGLAE